MEQTSTSIFAFFFFSKREKKLFRVFSGWKIVKVVEKIPPIDFLLFYIKKAGYSRGDYPRRICRITNRKFTIEGQRSSHALEVEPLGIRRCPFSIRESRFGCQIQLIAPRFMAPVVITACLKPFKKMYKLQKTYQ